MTKEKKSQAHLVIHTCGTARNNPGEAGVGLVIDEPSGSQTLVSENIGIASTIQAQYQAVIMALLWTADHNYSSVEIMLDNAKIIRSLLHNPTVNDLNILGLHKRARRLARSIQVTYSIYENDTPQKALALALEASMRNSADQNADSENRHALQQSAGGVLYKKDGEHIKVCLISKKGGTVWSLPKGRIKPGETWEETAVREVLEETGHLASIGEQIDQIEYFFYWKEDSTFYYKLVLFFLMPLVEENASTPDNEANEVAWVDIGEAWNRLYYQSEKNILRKAQKILHTANFI
ncbi:NUDIX domain-containing protein [bacterium]|nr:NUDIX domain-containing protein [bacterium]